MIRASRLWIFLSNLQEAFFSTLLEADLVNGITSLSES